VAMVQHRETVLMIASATLAESAVCVQKTSRMVLQGMVLETLQEIVLELYFASHSDVV
jgi:hypothetical protein